MTPSDCSTFENRTSELLPELCSITEIDGCRLFMSQTAEVERTVHISCKSVIHVSSAIEANASKGSPNQEYANSHLCSLPFI